jgi:ADP-heptose:LPS heptosyltransferase
VRLHRELLALIGVAGEPSILVLRALGLGDLLTAVPALRALRRGFPDRVLILAAPSWLAPLLPLTGAIDSLHQVSDMSELGRLDPPPTLAVNLHGRGPQSIAAVLRTGAPDALSHRHPDFPALPGPAWQPELHEVRRWCRLVASAGLKTDPDDLRLAVPAADPPARGAVVLHPGASAPSRRWPVQRFAAVARQLAGGGRRVVVTGSHAERTLCAELVQRAELPRTADLSGRLDLGELAALLAAASLVVCGDTGVAHLASAYATASVLLFGPTAPDRWGPPETGPHTVLWRGSVGDPHARTVDPGLDSLGVEEVLAAVHLRLPL